jgi:cytochrome d ubiquinol oxidase subunit II
LHAATAVCALAAFFTLYTRHYFWARLFAAAQVSLILWGWALAQFPNLLGSRFTLFNAAAPAVTLRLMLIALACGAFVLFPSLYCLYRVFRRSGQDAPI